MGKVIIGIHGLSNKPDPDVLAEGWKSAITEGLKKTERLQDPDFQFRSVYWADVTHPKPDDNPDLYKPAAPGALKTYKETWLDSVEAKAFDWGGDLLDSIKKNFGVHSLADEVLKLKLQDLSKYYADANVRSELRQRLKGEILNNQEERIMVISHSMGTIIAYDVLRSLGKEYPRLVIDHFVTLGSPLGLPHVKYEIAQENALVRTPTIVRKWSNFADKRDPVAFDTHLAGDYEPNDSGVSVQDDLVANDWGGIHHKSYGYLRTPEVSSAILNFI